MKLISDENGRLACKALFPPRTPFSAERQADGSIRVVELVEKDVPVIRTKDLVRTKDGFLICRGWKPSKKEIAAAIRADRDSR